MDRVMTRKGAARLEESKLQLTLLELKKYKDLCEELQREQDDNEKEVLQILNNNSKLKSEMAELHSELVNITEERDKLKLLVDRFDECSDEFDLTLKHNAELKCRLSEAQDTILKMDSASQRIQAECTHALFDKLVGTAPLPSANSILDNNQVETIDLTCDTTIISNPKVQIIKNTTNIKTAQSAYYAKVYSILNYGVIYWGNSVDSKTTFLLQKRCIRIIHNLDNETSCRPTFKKFGYLTLTGIYIFQAATFIKCNSNYFPDKNSLEYNRRLRNRDKLIIPQPHNEMYKRNMYFTSIKIYNHLPCKIRSLKSIEHCFYDLKEYFEAKL